MFVNLNLPKYSFKTKVDGGILKIFDPIRRKYIVLTPEEWVRQNFVQFLITEKKFPSSLLALEFRLSLNTLKKRSDIVVFNREAQPVLMVECKAPEVKITQEVFDQIARYNMSVNVNYLVVTNGLNHYCCILDHEKKGYLFLKDIPFFEEL